MRYIFSLRYVGVSTQKLQYPTYGIFKKMKNYSFLNFTKMYLGISIFLIRYERPLADLPIWKHVKN